MNEVLDAISANATTDYSAHHALAARLSEENNPEHQRDIYLDVASQADDIRWKIRLGALYDQGILPPSLYGVPESPGGKHSCPTWQTQKHEASTPNAYCPTSLKTWDKPKTPARS